MDMGGNKMRNRNIPTNEEFAKASAAMRYQARGLNEVCERVLSRFCKTLHEVFIFDHSELSFGVCVFYRLERQVNEAKRSGLESKIKEAIFEELENVGRGNRNTIIVKFTFDSHENVEKKFGGNYYDRLR
jgi:hypothetical protein